MNWSLKYRKSIVDAKRDWDKNQTQKVFRHSSSIAKSIRDRQRELCIYGGGVAILSKAEGKPILLYSPEVQKHFGIKKDADKYEYLHTPYDSLDWSGHGFDNFIDLLFFISRDKQRPEYVGKISELKTHDEFEYPFQRSLRSDYEILHCSTGEILFFILLWRLLIELVIKNNSLNCKYSKILFQSQNQKEDWFEVFQKPETDVFEKLLIEKLIQAASTSGNALSKNVLEAQMEFLRSIKCDKSVKYIFTDLGLFNSKALAELNRYTQFIFKDKSLQLNKSNSDDFADKIILAFLKKAKIHVAKNSLENLLNGLHSHARFPILPYYFLMLFDKKKQLKEHIVFPLWYTFSPDTKYPYDKNKSESAVLHALYTVKPIWENKEYGKPVWYTSDSKSSTPKRNVDLERYLNDLYSFFTSMSKPIIDKEYYATEASKNIDTVKRQAIRAAISQVMARNMSHNIGSHVLSRMIRWNDIAKFTENYESSLFSITKSNEERIECFNSYLKTRMDFLADIATSTPTIQNTKQFLSELLKGFDDNRLLLNKISGITNFDFTIKVFKDEVELTDGEDFPVSISNDVLGFHAFYVILENIIRNTAKHSYSKDKTKNEKTENMNSGSEKINFRIDVKDNDEVPDNSYYEITISDSIPQTDLVPLTPVDLKKYKPILPIGVKSIARIKKLVFDQNTRLNKSILDDETNLLRQGAWGLIEMDVSAAYLRKISQENVDDDKYQIPITPIEIKKHETDDKREKLKIIEAVQKNNCLGYRFYLPKPKELLIIDSNGNTWNEMFSKKQETLNQWKNKGILFLKESITDNDKWTFRKEISYPHELVLLLDSDKTIQSPFISKRQITFAELKQCYLDFHNRNRKSEEQLRDIDVLQLKQEDLITEAWRAWVVKQKKSKSIGNFDDVLIDDYLPLEQKEKSKYTFAFREHGRGLVSDDPINYTEIHPSQFEKSVEKISHHPKAQGEILNEKFKFFDSALSNILILDERIQHITLNERYRSMSNVWFINGLSYREIWDRVNVYIPTEDEINLNNKNFLKSSMRDIKRFTTHRLLNGIRDSGIENKKAINTNNRICLGVDFIVIHLGVIEKILKAERNPNKDENAIKLFIERLNAEFPKATVVVTSGRGKPENLPNDIPYLGYSIVSQYLIENRFKSLFTQALYSARPQNR